MQWLSELPDWSGFAWSEVEPIISRCNRPYRILRTYPGSSRLALQNELLYVVRQTLDKQGCTEFILAAKQECCASQQ